MKKILAFVLVLICCFSLCACGKGKNDKNISLLTDDFTGTLIITGKSQTSLLSKENTFEVILDGETKKVDYFINGIKSSYFGRYDLNRGYENNFTPQNVINVLNSSDKEIDILSLINSLSNPEIRIDRVGNDKVASITCEKYRITNKKQKLTVLICREVNFIMKIYDDNLTYYEITDFVVEVGDVSIND